MIPYRLALSIACVTLTTIYLLDRDASPIARAIVLLVVVASFIAPTSRGLPWDVTAIVAQLGISLFVLLRQIARGT